MTATLRSMPPVVVIDAIMGAGKTTYIIDHMNRAHSEALGNMLTGRSTAEPPRFLYVTPLLDEVDRVKGKCPWLDFKDPVPVEGRKYHELDRLIDAGHNIATTHALFGLITQETLGKLREKNYTLVIDEVLTCVDYFTRLKAGDWETIFGGGHVYVDQATSLLRWNHEKWPASRPCRYDDIRTLCDNGNLIAWSMSGDFTPGKKGSVLLWAFPTNFLAAFKGVYLLTYLFHGSPMRAYLEAEGVRFDLRTVADKGRKLVPWSVNAEKQAKERIRKHLAVYEGHLNDVGTRPRGTKANPLSKGWFTRASDETLKNLRTAATNFFRRFTNSDRVTPAGLIDSRFFAWTTFKAQRKALAGKGYKHHTQWIAVNAKATNDYRHKRVLAYLANRFSIPEISSYFESRGVDVYDDLYATSEMLQWLWRSAIRDEVSPTTVHVFVPSERMRGLLKLWLSCDDALTFIKEVTGKDLGLSQEREKLAA